MSKKFLLLILSIQIILLVINVNALSIDGIVKNSADCTDSAYRVVWVYWEGYRNNCPGGYPSNFCASVSVGASNDMYSIGGNSLNTVFPGWGVGSTFLIEVPDLGDGYYAGPVNVTINSLGESPRAPEMTLTSNHLGVVPLNGVCADTDNDLINDVSDNCPLIRNRAPGGQPDEDGDGYGGPNFYNQGCDPDDYNPLVPEPEAQCGGTITGSKTLPHSLFCRSTEGLTIGANNVVLDCSGLGNTPFRLNGNGSNTGIKLASGVTGATIKNCQIRNFQIGLRAPGASNNNNLIFNNFFNNVLNVHALGSNTWSIAKTAGTNIVGGPFLAGNFWSDYIGKDINWDWIGDTNLPYNMYIQNGGDSAPLVIHKPALIAKEQIIASVMTRYYATESNYVDQANPSSTPDPNAPETLFRWDGNEVRSYLKFDISSLPANAVVESATLSYYVTNNLSDPQSFDIYSIEDVGDGWSESALTWENAPPIQNVTASVPSPPAPNTRYSLPLPASYIQSEVNGNGNKIVTLVFRASLQGVQNGPVNQWSIATEEIQPPQKKINKPTLIIKYR